MTPTTCLYCGSALDGSEEHVLLSALGGKKQSTTICCSTCNNTLGGTIDKSFAERLHVFMNLIDGKTGRSKKTATLTNLPTDDGEKINLQPGGKPVLTKASVSESMDSSGKKHITILAPADKTPAILAGKMTQHAVSLDDIQVNKCVSTSKYVGTELNVAIGGLNDLRVVAKILLSYLAVLQPDETRSGSLSEIIELVRDAVDVPSGWLGFDFSTQFPAELAKGEFEHRMFVFASAEEKLAFGLLELFGEIRFSCVLSTRWQGPTLGSVYCVDPVAGIHSERHCELPKHITKATLLARVATDEQLLAAIEGIASRAFEKIRHEANSEMAHSVLQEHLHRTDLDPEHKFAVISQTLAQKFVNQMYRLDHESTVNVKDFVDPNTT